MVIIKDIHIRKINVVHLARVTTWKYKMGHPLMAFQAGEDVDTNI